MAKGSIRVGDEVVITATVRERVTPDQLSVAIPHYPFPHSIVDRTSGAKKGQRIELTGPVTRVDERTVTVDLMPPVTVPLEQVRVVTQCRLSTRRSW